MSKVVGQSPAKRRIRWIGAAIVVVGAVAGGVVLALARQDDAGPARVVTATVDTGEVTVEVATIGTVEPAGTRRLSFAIGGTVASVAVRAGNRVTAGQTLATLDPTEAAGDVSDAQARLAEAQTRLAGGTDVAVATTRNATTCARESVQPAAAGCPTRGYPDTGADQVLSAQQAVNRAAKAVADAQDALDGTAVKAPIAGTVVEVSAHVGDQVDGGSAVVSLADTNSMQVRADFPEADAGALAVGQAATVTLADSDETADATVVQVDPVGTSDGTMVRYGVLLGFADAPADLLAGQSAQVRVRTGVVASAVRVPSTAVHDVSGGSGTVLVRAGGRSVQRAVSVGLRGGQYTQITDGLVEGEQVVRSW